MKRLTIFSILIFIFTACNSNSPKNNEQLPTENQLPQVPNCAADGEGCQQFNPNL